MHFIFFLSTIFHTNLVYFLVKGFRKQCFIWIRSQGICSISYTILLLPENEVVIIHSSNMLFSKVLPSAEGIYSRNSQAQHSLHLASLWNYEKVSPSSWKAALEHPHFQSQNIYSPTSKVNRIHHFQSQHLTVSWFLTQGHFLLLSVRNWQ